MEKKLKSLKVRDLMNIDVMTVNSKDSLLLVDDIIRLGKLKHLPVIDKNEKIIGLLSHRDFVRACPSNMAELSAQEKEEFLRSVKVSRVMTEDVYTVGPEMLLKTAADIMVKHRYGCLPVVERGKLIGIITESDFVRYFLKITA